MRRTMPGDARDAYDIVRLFGIAELASRCVSIVLDRVDMLEERHEWVPASSPKGAPIEAEADEVKVNLKRLALILAACWADVHTVDAKEVGRWEMRQQLS